jgi:tetrahydromethanopterin S-methyltransferase subunit G
MKTVFEASSGLEAHMILNLLQQHGIDCRIDGEYLQGGVGELQAMSIVRVLVDETDYDRARTVIDEWDATQVDNTVIATSAGRTTGIATGIIIGLSIGAGLTIWAYNSPATVQGIDYNKDGLLDEKYFYRDNRIVRTEIDRNLDGKTDAISYFNLKGLLYKAETDDDFDGTYETVYKYRRGNLHTQESDLDQDGHVDYLVYFNNGLLSEIIITGPDPDSPRKKQRYHMNKLVGADYDADGDGLYDVSYEYDFYEEIKDRTLQ